jgi:hypothetical protein
MDFHAGEVESSVRRRSQIANACRRRADEHDLAAKRIRRNFLLHDVGE